MIQYTEAIQTKATEIIDQVTEKITNSSEKGQLLEFLRSTQSAYQLFNSFVYELVHVLFSKVVEPTQLNHLNSLAPFEISQKTPIRVLHRF